MGKSTKAVSLLAMLTLAGGVMAGCSTSGNGGNENQSSNTSETNNGATNTTETQTDTATTPVDGGTLTYGSFSDIVTVNPIYVSDTASGDAESFLFSKLYDYDRQGNVVAEPWSLAEELPEISADSKEYTIKLKHTAKWSDGEPVTANDIKFTFDTIRNPDAAAYAIGSFDKVASVDVIDDYTVKVTLSQVYAPFLNVLVTPLVPEHVLKDVDPKTLEQNPYGTDPAKTVTNGPWKWTEWQQKQYLTFDADANYWGAEKPHISKVVYKIYADQNTEVQALITGDIDMTSAIPVTQIDAVKARNGLNVILNPGPQYEFLSFNFKKENFPDNYGLFDGEKTRQAIAHAINRQGIIDNVLKGSGKPINSPFLPGSWADPGDNAVSYDYNAETAKQLLAEDGWVVGKDGTTLEKDGHPFAFELQYNSGNSRREQVSAIIQQNLADVGIKVTTKAIDFSSWVEQNLNTGKFQAVLLAWSLDSPDPDAESTFSSKYYPPAGSNQGFYNNPALDKLWVEGYSTVDRTERKKIYDEVAKEISTNLPYAFLYQYGSPEALGSRVHYDEADAPESALQYGYLFHVLKWWVN